MKLTEPKGRITYIDEDGLMHETRPSDKRLGKRAMKPKSQLTLAEELDLE